MSKIKLAVKERKFVDAYFKNPNPRDAIIATGAQYKTPESARVMGNQMLQKPQVQAAIAERMAQVEAKGLVDIEYVLTSLKDVAERCRSRRKFDSSGANRSLELLGKYLKMFEDHSASSPTFIL